MDALAIFRELGCREDEAHQLGNIGSTYRDMGDKDNALKYYRESLAIFKEIGHKMGIANELSNVGYILAVKGDPHNALRYFKEALPLFKELGAAERAEMTRKNIDILMRKTM